jgi:hydrogenase 3 maturation protease
MGGKKTSRRSWNRNLRENLTFLRSQKQSKSSFPGSTQVLRIAWVGVGSELNGDDAAGLYAIRGLAPILMDEPHFLCLESGVNPENALGPLRKFHPDLVVMVDAADFGESAGNIRFIKNAEVGGISFSTHSLPMNLISEYLGRELDCPVWLLGIQPASLEFAAPLTIKVRRAVDSLVLEISRIIQ